MKTAGLRTAGERPPGEGLPEERDEPLAAARTEAEVKGIWSAAAVRMEREEAQQACTILEAASAKGKGYAELNEMSMKAQARFEEKLGQVYTDPQRARENFNDIVRTEGFAESLRTLHERPEALGWLKGTAALGFESTARTYARTEAEALHVYAGNAVAHEAAAYRLKTAQLMHDNEQFFVERRARADDERRAVLGAVFQDPDAAMRNFDAVAGPKPSGTEEAPNPAFAAAMKTLRARPETFGELKGGAAGWVEDSAREEARRLAAEAGDVGRAMRAAQDARADVAVATGPMNEAHRVLDDYRAESARVERRVESLPDMQHGDRALDRKLARSTDAARSVAAGQAERMGTAAKGVMRTQRRLETARGEALFRSDAVGQAFGKLFLRPEQARANFERAAGLDSSTPRYIDASVQLGKQPDAFGPLARGLGSKEAVALGKEAAAVHKSYARSVMETGGARAAHTEALNGLQQVAGVLGAGRALGRLVRQVEEGKGIAAVGDAATKGAEKAATTALGPMGTVAARVVRKAGEELRRATAIDRDI